MRAPAEPAAAGASPSPRWARSSLSALRRGPAGTPGAARRRPSAGQRAGRRSTRRTSPWTSPTRTGRCGRRPLGLLGDRREGRRPAGRGDRAGRRPYTVAAGSRPGWCTTSSPATARSWRTPSTGTPRTPTATSGTSASRPRSTRTGRSSRPRARGRPASTGRSRASPSPPIPRPGLTYRQEYLAGEAEDQGACCRRPSRWVCRPASTPGALLTRDTTRWSPTWSS